MKEYLDIMDVEECQMFLGRGSHVEKIFWMSGKNFEQERFIWGRLFLEEGFWHSRKPSQHCIHLLIRNFLLDPPHFPECCFRYWKSWASLSSGVLSPQYGTWDARQTICWITVLTPSIHQHKTFNCDQYK